MGNGIPALVPSRCALLRFLGPLSFLRAMADSADRATVWSTAFRSSFGQGQVLQDALDGKGILAIDAKGTAA